MKKLFLSLIMLGIFAVVASADFKKYTVSASTFPVTGNSTYQISSLGVMTPNIAGAARIGKLIISNSDDTTVQTVTLYTLGASSRTITAIGVINFGAGDQSAPFVLECNTSDMIAVSGFAVRKSTTASDVNVTVFYK
jgi:hypothetical protein